MNRILEALASVARLAARVGDSLRWLSPAVARLTVGLVFFQSGWAKLHDLESVSGFFAQLGLPAPGFQAALASTTELVGGAFLLAGLATRLAAVPLIVVMLVAIRTALWDQVDGVGALVGLLEFSYIALLLWLFTHGAGPLSLDGLLEPAGGKRAGSASARAVA